MDPIIEAISSAVFDMPRIYSIIGRLKKDRMELKNTSSPELPAKTTGLDFTEAMSALADGHKVRLPEWTGYWFQQGKDIKVFTRTGDTLDTPNWKFYAMREDWSIVTEGMGFEFALLALKAGKRVRISWWNYDVFLFMQSPVLSNKVPYIMSMSRRFGSSPWVPDHISLFDTSWELYNEVSSGVDEGLMQKAPESENVDGPKTDQVNS